MSKLPVFFPNLRPPTKVMTEYTEAIRQTFVRVAGANNNPDHGITAARPTAQLTMGQFFYDTTLNKPIWWNATTATWKDATGGNV